MKQKKAGAQQVEEETHFQGGIWKYLLALQEWHQ